MMTHNVLLWVERLLVLILVLPGRVLLLKKEDRGRVGPGAAAALMSENARSPSLTRTDGQRKI